MGSQNKVLTLSEVSLSDKDFFEKVFNELYGPLVTFAQSFLSDRQVLAEDIVQDVFTDLLLKKTKFHSKISLKSYLYLSVKNRIINSEKHKGVKKSYAEKVRSLDQKENAPFFDRIIEEEMKYQLVSAMNKLPNRCKKVFELSLKGFRNDEIATEMKISVETVKTQKKKGKTLLKSLLSPKYFGLIFYVLH